MGVGGCEAAPLRKQSHKEKQGDMKKEEGKREETAQIPKADW